MNLYFKDLTEDAQKRLLEEKDIKKPEEMNWDTLPLTEV